MQVLTLSARDEVVLRKPSRHSGHHEMLAGRNLVGVLDLSAWSRTAHARAADGHWRFHPTRRILRGRVDIVDDTGLTRAAFRYNGRGRGGVLDVAEHTYTLRKTHGWWKPGWVWTENDVELAVWNSHPGLRREKGWLHLTEAGKRCPHVSLLALFGAYVMLLHLRSRRAVAGTGGAASTP